MCTQNQIKPFHSFKYSCVIPYMLAWFLEIKAPAVNVREQRKQKVKGYSDSKGDLEETAQTQNQNPKLKSSSHVQIKTSSERIH